MTSTTVGEDNRRLASHCGGRNGRYRGGGGRRALFILCCYCPVCLFYAIVISAVFLLPFVVVRAFKEIRRRHASVCDNLGFLQFPRLLLVSHEGTTAL